MRALLVAAGLVSLAIAQNPSVQTLFDGESLKGWRGDPAVWRVEDGCIVGSNVGRQLAANTFLVLDGREPGDFVLSMRVRLEGDNNSGIQYRSRELPGGAFAVAGYQCDVNRTPEHLGMLYDERGGGIIATHGSYARWADDGVHVVGPVNSVRKFDLSRWYQYSIFARGDLVWHTLNGELIAAARDVRRDAPRKGVIALQVHAGPPMTARFADVKLLEYAGPAAFAREVPVPPVLAALLLRDELRSAALRRRDELRAAASIGATPAWVWDGSPQDGEEVFFRRTFELPAAPQDASLVVSCDNHCRVYVNGERLGTGDEWEHPVRLDAVKALCAGQNVIAVHGINDGGPGALSVRLSWQHGGKEHEIVTDAQWRCSDDDPDGWSTAAFDDAKWTPVTVLAAMGDPKAPWTRVHGADALGAVSDPFAPQVAIFDTSVTFHGTNADSPETLRLLDVPRALGSWVSLCVDDKYRLYASAERGGLYRIRPAPDLGELTKFERVPVEIGGAHGLLWFRDALYAVVNTAGSSKQSGLYRITDTNGDDVLDRVELLQSLEGDGEHGPHSVVVAPDRGHLLVVCGNQTKLPPLARSHVPTNWREDRLLPRLDDPNPYWEGHSPPGGWVCQCDADGRNWELICCGFRNPYDLAVTESGVVWTFDSDMEWDMGLPWYRPTRVLRVQSGVDYGWRIGSAKWPADYPESPLTGAFGPGSPTGMSVHGPYVLMLDWTFGTVHCGGPWLTGTPLPVADIADRYIVTGGRGLPSALLRIPLPALPHPHGPVAPPPLSRREEGLAELLAFEARPVAEYRQQVLEQGWAPGLHALARNGAAADLQPVLDALGKSAFGAMQHDYRIAWLRVHALALLRLGPANDAQRAAIAQRLLPLFPTGNERQDQDLAELLAYVDAPGFLDKAVPQLTPMRPSPVPEWAKVAHQADVYGDQYAGVIRAMVDRMPPIGQIAIADALRIVKHGWTLAQRREYFTFLGEARTRKGGASYDGYLKKIIDAAWATCSPAEQQALADVVGKAKADAPKFRSTPPKGPGRDWQLGDIDGVLRDGPGGLGGLGNADVAAGHNLFHAAGCASCHYFAGEGGNHGPDLTSLGNKFTARDVLEAILEPSKVTSEQYAGQVLTKQDGTTLFGYVTKGHHGDVEVYEVMPAAADAAVVRIPATEVTKVERSPLSPMPKDLADRLSAAELRDLLAFLLSRGRR